MPKKRKYQGNLTSRASELARRHKVFETAFRTNGENATQAAKDAGYSPHSAKTIGSMLATRLNLKRAAGEGERAAFQSSRLNTEAVLGELERIVFSDVRKLYHKGGVMKDITELDDDTAAAIASVDYSEGEISKVRTHDKLVAIDRAMKHLGLFERDNRQKEQNLTIQIGLVSAPLKKEE